MHGGRLDDHINFLDPSFRLSNLDIAVDTQASHGKPSDGTICTNIGTGVSPNAICRSK
jgi:hypothetical protein